MTYYFANKKTENIERLNLNKIKHIEGRKLFLLGNLVAELHEHLFYGSISRYESINQKEKEVFERPLKRWKGPSRLNTGMNNDQILSEIYLFKRNVISDCTYIVFEQSGFQLQLPSHSSLETIMLRDS